VDIQPNIKDVDLDKNKLDGLIRREKDLLKKKKIIQLQSIRDTMDLQNRSGDIKPGDIIKVVDELNMIYDQMEKIDPEYVSLKRPKPITLDKITNNLDSTFSNGDKSTIVIVEYFVTDSRLYIFCIFQGKLYVKGVDELTKSNLYEYMLLYDVHIRNYYPGRTNGNILQELSRYLIEPVKDILIQTDSIIFIPHSSLHYVPIHALELNGKPLIMTHKISYLPTAGLLQFIDRGNKLRAKKPKSCNVFGVALSLPKEQELLEEAKEIAAVMLSNDKEENNNSISKYIENPSKDKVLQNLDADILHFSCHGYFDIQVPLKSGIVLKDMESLTAKDILSLSGDNRISADLVTLSACDTGISDNKPGDELIGLSRSLIYAGANSLILSLWPVSSKAAKETMISFYSNLKNGDTKAEALQKAQISLRERWSEMHGQEEGGHPYFWAPFILIGDWR